MSAVDIVSASDSVDAHDDNGPSVVTLQLADTVMVSLLGPHDHLLRQIETSVAADIHVRGNTIRVSATTADQAGRVAQLFADLAGLIEAGQHPDQAMVEQAVNMMHAQVEERPADVFSDTLVTHRGRSIRPKTLGQKRYLDAIRRNTVTFGIGPAGTGKTYLAMGAAVQALRAKDVNRLVLTRPAVEAGERLGFLPGTLHEKIDPYLKPLWDALQDMMEPEELVAHVDRGTIEVAPLAYMRGRTLNDSFIVLDEAQNTTAEQMKMFLTRIGFNSKAVVTGDISQVDLPAGRASGLRTVRDILTDIDGVAFAYLTPTDVVRHHIVQRIVEAYEAFDAGDARRTADSGAAVGSEHERQP
ncbi:MAG: PhoH family protein [Nitriliruptoraceae bacterium]